MSLLRDQPHDEGQDEGEDGNGRLNGGGVGGVGVAEAKQEQQLVAKDSADQPRRSVEANLQATTNSIGSRFQHCVRPRAMSGLTL